MALRLRFGVNFGSMAFEGSITYGLTLLLGIPQPVTFRD